MKTNINTNLKKRYISVLKKCAIINTFGSLALAATLAVGASDVFAAEIVNDSVYDKAQKLTHYEGNSYDRHISESKMISGKIMSDSSTENLTFLASRQDNQTKYKKVVAEESAVIVNESSITVVKEQLVFVNNYNHSVWFQPMYQGINATEFNATVSTPYGTYSADDYDYTRNAFGVNIGADITLSDQFTVGASVQTGVTDSTLARVVNTQGKFYGIALYATYTMDALTVKADLGYVYTDTDVEAAATSVDNSGNSITLGAVAEYRFETEMFDLIPYAGLRLTHVSSTEADFGYGISLASNSATAFTVPVGLRVEKEFMTETGVSVIPHANIGFEFAMGDLDEVEAVTIVGVRNESRFMSNVFDPVTFQIGVGLELVKDQYSFNFDYDYRLSNHAQEHAIMANFRYKF